MNYYYYYTYPDTILLLLLLLLLIYKLLLLLIGLSVGTVRFIYYLSLLFTVVDFALFNKFYPALINF